MFATWMFSLAAFWFAAGAPLRGTVCFAVGVGSMVYGWWTDDHDDD